MMVPCRKCPLPGTHHQGSSQLQSTLGDSSKIEKTYCPLKAFNQTQIFRRCPSAFKSSIARSRATTTAMMLAATIAIDSLKENFFKQKAQEAHAIKIN